MGGTRGNRRRPYKATLGPNGRFRQNPEPRGHSEGLLHARAKAVRLKGGTLFVSAIRQQSRLLPQRHDAPWPPLDGFLKRCPRNPVITGKSGARLNMEGRIGVPTKREHRQGAVAV